MLTNTGVKRRWRWALLLALIAAAGTLTLGGCARTAFYWQAARGQWELVREREPVAEVLAGDTLDPLLRERLALAFEARVFASESLGLPDNKSYRTYVQLDRPHVLWNVVAAPEFSVDPQTYCFPFAGCVSYRGFFREAAAREETERLQAEGLDAFYGGVGAYSTLGRFADPILSSMLSGDELSVIALIFHELAHQVVYRPSDSPFSESFATFVEREGLRRFLLDAGRSADYEKYLNAEARREDFAALVSSARDQLREVYAQSLGAEQKRERKRAAIDALRARYAKVKSSWGGYAGYDGWFSRELNNAHLATVSTYNQWVGAFGALLAEHDGDLPAFYAAVEALAKQDDAAVLERLEALNLSQ
ncbi:MAG: aminopeptidase [Gammaproteobacteria bacterium]